MVRNFTDSSDPKQYVNLVGIVGTNGTAGEHCKKNSITSQVTVDPEHDHKPFCKCEPMFHGDSSPWQEFNCTGECIYIYIYINIYISRYILLDK